MEFRTYFVYFHTFSYKFKAQRTPKEFGLPVNYTVEVGSKLTLFTFFILRIRERKLVRWLLEVEVFMPRI